MYKVELRCSSSLVVAPRAKKSLPSTQINKLIQDGAHPVTHINDILMSLNLYMVPQQVEAQADLPTSIEEQALLALLGQEPCHIDDLIRESQLGAQDVTAALTTLELKGMVKQVGGMQYIRAVRG